MKILFLVPYPIEGASNRYRVHQYIPYLKRNNIPYRVRSFIFPRFYYMLYKKKKAFSKFIYLLMCMANRLFDLLRAMRYDVIFIHRECFPFGPPIIEFILSKILLKHVIYDFDDAIFLRENKKVKFLDIMKNPKKVKKIIAWSTYVIAGNKYLQNYALRFNKNVKIIPTSIETTKFKISAEKGDKLIIGWIGSHSTVKYILEIFDVFQELTKKYDFDLRIIGANKKIEIPGVNVVYKKWDLKNEITDFQELTIGVYPLPSNKWTLGKCGFKAIQYMATGVPTIASPVGVNKDIISDGKNGFLAYNKEEWIKKLSKLIENKKLRKKLGQAGRKTVEKNYSVAENFLKLQNILNKFGRINTIPQNRYSNRGNKK